MNRSKQEIQHWNEAASTYAEPGETDSIFYKYHRNLTYYFDHLRANRLAITRLFEPVNVMADEGPAAEFRKSIPILLVFEARPLAT